MSGFITLHRDIQDHWIFKDPEQFRAWVIMLMAANWEPREVPCGTYVTKCDRGQFIRSQEQLAEMFGWTRSKVQRFLKLLTNANMIRSETAHKANKITVVNYSTYQDMRSNNDQKMINRRSEDDQKMGTENHYNNINHNKPCEEQGPLNDSFFEKKTNEDPVDIQTPDPLNFLAGKLNKFIPRDPEEKRDCLAKWSYVIGEYGLESCEAAYKKAQEQIAKEGKSYVYPEMIAAHARLNQPVEKTDQEKEWEEIPDDIRKQLGL